MMMTLLYVEREWQASNKRKFGIGNISLANGTANASVRRVLFNDTAIPFVTPFKNHDHHFHLELSP
ncbi:hypothetical protein ACQ4W6_25625 [Janthinobacterium sp. HLX7-2]